MNENSALRKLFGYMQVVLNFCIFKTQCSLTSNSWSLFKLYSVKTPLITSSATAVHNSHSPVLSLTRSLSPFHLRSPAPSADTNICKVCERNCHIPGCPLQHTVGEEKDLRGRQTEVFTSCCTVKVLSGSISHHTMLWCINDEILL